MAAKDWIDLFEAIYDLDGTDEQWRERLLDCAVPLLGRAIDRSVIDFRNSPHGLLPIARLIRKRQDTLRAAVDAVHRNGIAYSTTSENMLARYPERRAVARGSTRVLIEAAMAVGGHRAAGHDLPIGVSLGGSTVPSAPQRLRWPRIARHLDAGLDLRRIAQSMAREADRSGCAREVLRDAVSRIDRARACAGPGGRDATAEYWKALMAGRWSLFDRFDSDGRRFVVAVCNDARFSDPRGLTLREGQTAELIGLGRSPKQIADTLGLSVSAVTNRALWVQRKLGLGSLAELAAFFAATGGRARVAEMAVCGLRLLVSAYPLIDRRAVAPLSKAERQVAALLVTGSSNSNIAQRRGSSPRTVANQVQSIFRKLGTRSRSELALRLQARQ